MERLEFTVRGEDAWTVPRAIRGYPPNKRVDYDGDGFAVIVTEQYYFRTNSNLQTTTIFELVDDGACRVTIVSGGGGQGFVQHDWGSESRESNELVGKIEDYCRENDLEVDHG